jgi:hypothetical protein
MTYLADAIKKVVENNDDYKLRTDYSGRGMYGKACVGIVAYSPDEVLKEIILEINDLEDPYYRADIINELFDYRTDSMGLKKIIYWPNIKADEFDEEDSEESEE